LQCKKYLTTIWILAFCLSAEGQCPSKDTLWTRINFLANAAISDDEQLKELLHISAQLKDCNTKSDSVDELLLHRIGVLYYYKGNFEKAINYTLSALNPDPGLNDQIYINPKQRIKSYRNLSVYYDSLNLVNKKIEAVDSCISIAQRSNLIDEALLISIGDKVEWLFDIGDYSRCLQYTSLSQTLAEKSQLIHSNVNKRTFSFRINTLLLMKNYSRAETELRGKIEEYENRSEYKFVGNLYQLWAAYYLGTGKIDSVILNNKLSFQFNLERKFYAGCASSLNGIGFIYYKYLGNYSKSLEYYFKALPYAGSSEAISILNNIGNVYVKRNQYDSAFYYYQKSFNQIDSGINETGLLNARNNEVLNNLAEYVVSLVLDKSDAHLSQYLFTKNPVQLKQTLSSYRIADQLLDKIKQNQFETNSKLFWRKSVRRLYEHAIEACWLDHNVNEGFYFFEKSRAVLLDDQLKQDQLMQNQDVSRQFQLKRLIAKLEKELNTVDPNSNNFSAIQSELIRKKEEQDRMQLAIREKDPLDFARNPNEHGLQISDFRSGFLKDYAGLVEIFNGDSALFILTISGSDAVISKINKPAYDSLSKLFLYLISNPTVLNSQFPAFTSVSRKLYQIIFPDQFLKPGRIIISPDGPCFPFEALITNQGSDPYYLLNDYSISYTYSARFLMSTFSNNSDKSAGDFMGIAPVFYASYLNLASLPGSDISLRQINAHFRNGYTRVNESAVKNNFLTNFSDYNIVQLYSHAGYSTSTDEPVIYFADSSLYLSELISKDKPATRLVVLSACETALGQEYKGEGVFSFSREFAALGIPASVSNLWSVDNGSTYRVTELFYKYITNGLPTDLALQKAKLEFIKNAPLEKTLPFYWAAPILTGKAEIIKTKTPLAFRSMIAFLGLALILFFFGFKFIKGRHGAA
jgi:tetratricopeptide (TPR) repeat protein